MFTRPVAFVAALMLLFATAVASAAPKKDAATALSVPVVGSFSGGVFNGTFKLVEFVAEGTQLSAHGTLVGTLTSVSGMPLGTVMKSVSIPVKASAVPSATRASAPAPGVVALATCPILSLDLGPLNLDLLGLVVDLSAIALDITAVSGAGNLLGNLLCAVVQLLDPVTGGALGQIADLLNQILGILGGILG